MDQHCRQCSSRCVSSWAQPPPQEFRHRIDTPSLRGVNLQRVFGSQRALSSVEDFTEFEQRAAYFDGDPVIAASTGRK